MVLIQDLEILLIKLLLMNKDNSYKLILLDHILSVLDNQYHLKL